MVQAAADRHHQTAEVHYRTDSVITSSSYPRRKRSLWVFIRFSGGGKLRALVPVTNFMRDKSKQLCACGSGKRAKACCGGASRVVRYVLNPSSKLEPRIKAEALAKAGKHLEACEVLEQLVAVSPRNPLIWNELGIQYEASGQTDKAFDALRRGNESDPTYAPLIYNMGKLTLDCFLRGLETGDLTISDSRTLLDKAIKFLNANLDRDPDNADAHYLLALAYTLDEDEQEADAHLAVALRMKQGTGIPPAWRLK